MKIAELFHALSVRGLTVRRHGDELSCTGSASDLTDDIRTALVEHRQHFLDCLPDSQDAIQRKLDEFVEWLNRTAPDSYDPAEHSEWWDQLDLVIEEAVGTGDPGKVAFEIESAKPRIVDRFLPYHARSSPIDSQPLWPDHQLLDRAREREAIQWSETASPAAIQGSNGSDSVQNGVALSRNDAILAATSRKQQQGDKNGFTQLCPSDAQGTDPVAIRISHCG